MDLLTKLPEMSDDALANLRTNAKRLQNSGTPAQRTDAAALLPAEPWNEETWGAWTKAVAAETGAKGRGLFHPLRLALTGLEHGPELKKLLPLIGRDRTLARLKGQIA